jgi:hypothetical protein
MVSVGERQQNGGVAKSANAVVFKTTSRNGLRVQIPPPPTQKLCASLPTIGDRLDQCNTAIQRKLLVFLSLTKISYFCDVQSNGHLKTGAGAAGRNSNNANNKDLLPLQILG